MFHEPLTATSPPRTSGDDQFESTGKPALDQAPLLGPVGSDPEDYNSSALPGSLSSEDIEPDEYDAS
jgi:hypothetical protein